jgi:putative tricarboxylic transport membrane protein
VKLNDAVWGALLLFLSAALLVHVQSFPTIPGQKVGPALFPGIVAAGLGICALLLVIKGLAARRTRGERADWIDFDAWTRHRRYVVAFLLTVCVNVFYILAVDRLGFLIVGTVYLCVLFIVYRVDRRWVLPVALIVTLGIHYAFYKLLRVPLPWGLLQGVAW